MRLDRCWPAAALIAISCSAPSCTHEYATYAEFDKFVEQTRQVYQVPGAAVGIVRDTGVVFIKGYGVRSIAGVARVDTSTKFQIASNTKFMTAAAIGTLVDSGRTTWDQPLVEHYPTLELSTSEATSKVSFRDLLSHQAGLRAYDGDLLGRLGWDQAEIIERAQYLTLDGFRDKARYSNMGFFIAGAIGAYISDVKALDWETHVTKALLEPLGMTRSSPHYAAMFLDENHVAGHRLKNGQAELMDLEMDGLPPAGSIVSTADDMARWVRMLLNRGKLDDKTILQPATVDTIFENAIETGPGGLLGEPKAGNGLGTENFTFLGTRVVTKNGALDGVRTVVVLIPEKKIGLFVLANLNLTVFPEAVQARFLEDQIGPSGKDLQTEMRDVTQKKWDSMSEPVVFPTDPAPLPLDIAQLAGTYSSAVYGDFSLTVDGSDLQIASSTPTVYTGKFRHWTGLQFLLDWGHTDDMLGLVTFQLSSDQTQVTGFAGDPPSPAPPPTINYGSFTRQ